MKNKKIFERGAGVLAHISSLPNGYGIGTFGKSAYAFVDLLAEAKVKYWQVLPLVQTGYGDSPYQSGYASSGNPYFIDLDTLAVEGLLKKSELSECAFAGEKIDYEFLYRNKYALLRKAFERFDPEEKDFQAFVEQGEFENYALFMAIKTKFSNRPFTEWAEEYKTRQPARLARFKKENYGEYLFWLFLQYEFDLQWKRLKGYANGKGIRVIGDIPLYVAEDSADVWANPSLFKLNKDLTPKKVAGVPPDYFSATGQLWGNPVYDWSAHKREGYRWWTERIRRALSTYDIVRIDHFRGFDRYYEVDAGADTAVGGAWQNGPKEGLFRALKKNLGELPFIAEDLGILDDGVYRLMKNTGYPGMKVLLFAFDGNENNPYLPENIGEGSVCYTGTHDNDTALGYLNSLGEGEFAAFASRVQEAAKTDGAKVCTQTREQTAAALCSLALNSKACIAVLPLQDLMGLGGECRMNTPATECGNWQFRLQKLPSVSAMRRWGKEVQKTKRG